MNADQKGQPGPLTELHKDILDTSELDKLATLDQVEEKLDMASGTLQFAIENTNNQAFYQGINAHIKDALQLISRLRK